MKISKSLFYFFTFFCGTALLAMEQHNVQKINGKEFSFITKSRTIPNLKALCLPALAIYISNLIKYDPAYDKTKFKECLAALDAHISCRTKK